MNEPGDNTFLEAENASLKDRMMRALAETENTRRRAERNLEEAKKFAVQKFARELLAVADNLRRAVASAPVTEGAKANPAASSSQLLDGVKATERILTSALESVGVDRMEPLGTPFNPAFHEAMLEIENTSYTPGHVSDVLEDGYTLHGRLLRPAKVSVAKAPSHPARSA